MKTAQTDSSATADLMDQRDNLVRQIAQYVDVRTVEQDDGSVSLFTSAGLQLLDGPPSLFSYDGTNVTRVGDTAPINNQLTGGRIHALLNFRQDSSASGKPVSMDPGTEVIRKLRAQLDMMVGALTTTSGTPPTPGGRLQCGRRPASASPPRSRPPSQPTPVAGAVHRRSISAATCRPATSSP